MKSNYLKDILFETETAISHLIISCQFLQLFLASLFFHFVSLVGKKRNWSLKELHHPFLVDWFNKSWFDLKTSFFFRIIFKTKTHTDVVQTSLRELLMFTYFFIVAIHFWFLRRKKAFILLVWKKCYFKSFIEASYEPTALNRYLKLKQGGARIRLVKVSAGRIGPVQFPRRASK